MSPHIHMTVSYDDEFASRRFAFYAVYLLHYYHCIIIYVHCINIHCLFVFFFQNEFVYLADSLSLANVHVSLNDIRDLISYLAIRPISPSFRFPKETNIITRSVSLKKRRKHSVEPHLQLRILAAC